MTLRVVPRQVAAIAGLTAIWCGLWGSVSLANIVSGAAVAAGACALGFGWSSGKGVRVLPLLKLLWLVLVDLVKSTFNVAIEVLTRADRTTEAVIAVQIPPGGRAHLLLLVVAISVTPGTAVVDAEGDSGAIYLHLLHHTRRAETIAHVEELVGLAAQALSPQPRRVAA